MKKIFMLFSLLSIVSCGGGSSGTNAFNNVTTATMASTPQITSSISAASLTFEGDISATEQLAFIQEFFKMQCHLYDNLTDDSANNAAQIAAQGVKENFCPVGIELTGNNKLTVSNLIGYVYHAIMAGESIYSPDDDRYKTCAMGDNATELNQKVLSYTTDSTNSATHNYIFNMENVFDCLATFTYDGATNYTAYNKSVDSSKYAILITAKERTMQGYGSISSDINQVFASQVDANGSPQLIALNIVTSNTTAARAVIMANVGTNKFVAKFQTVGGDYLTAIGKAGIGTNGTWVEGNYVVMSSTGGNAKIFCIKNGAEPAVLADHSQCAEIKTVLGGTGTTWTNADIVTYMGINAADAASLAEFVSALNNSNPFNANQVPTVGNHTTFPNSISGQ